MLDGICKSLERNCASLSSRGKLRWRMAYLGTANWSDPASFHCTSRLLSPKGSFSFARSLGPVDWLMVATLNRGCSLAIKDDSLWMSLSADTVSAEDSHRIIVLRRF